MTGTLRAGTFLALALPALACMTGAQNPNDFPPPSTTGTGNSSGTGGHAPASGEVRVDIESPNPDPNTDRTYDAESLLDVVAHVYVDGNTGTDFIDTASVRIAIRPAGGNTAVDAGQLVASGGDLYTGRMSIGSLPTGSYTLVITALSSGGKLGTAEIGFSVDAGPILNVASPVVGKHYKSSLTIEVFADVGIFEPMDGPNATLAGLPVTLDPVAGVDHTYRATIDFRAYDPPLADEQLLIVWATNGRGKRTELRIVFVIDEHGPIISSTLPPPGKVVGGVIRISASVSDPADVLDSSVIAVIGDDTTPNIFKLQLKPDPLGNYSILFDTARLTECPDPPRNGLCIVFPTISFRASDQLGNEKVLSYGFGVDNIAPVSDLDPPNIRAWKIDQGLERCSFEFDPLANNDFVGDMPNDRSIVPQVFDLRARIEDDGNFAAGLKEMPIAGIDPTETDVYVLDDEYQPLVVDTDGDGNCDAINPNLIPTTQPPTDNNQVLKIRLSAVPPQGEANFMPDITLPLAPPSPGFCYRGGASDLPKFLCTNLQPTVAISYAHGWPAIWSVDPVDKIHCFGNQFDTHANNISEGWACMAVASKDRNGNLGVSAPLRVQIKYDGTGAGTIVSTAPSCAGTYNPTAKTATLGTCKARKFDARSYYCFEGICLCPQGTLCSTDDKVSF